jgi:probable HAF family extracellular repeat protein
LIPIRWVFSNGMVVDASTDIVDGQTPVQGIINSPIFQNYDFTSGGTHVGNTQYGDAFQRANFWNSVSTKSPKYHVRLAQPIVLPTQTVVVPDDKVRFFTFNDGIVIPDLDFDYADQVARDLNSTLGISPQSLPINVLGGVAAGNAFGYHNAYQTGNSIQTFISTNYVPQAAVGYGGDVSTLSHEILEWLDDPFIDDYSPGWNYPFSFDPPKLKARCDSDVEGSDLLEVADPFELLGSLTDTPIQMNGFSYNLAEGAFIDFFTRQTRSRSVNGQFSFFEILRPYGFDTPPSKECVGGLHTDNQFFSVPGSTFSFAYGMNNTGSIVGYFIDQLGVHGFVKDRFGYRSLDYPGAAQTLAQDINDGGTIVGYFAGSDGYPHGFIYKNGRFSRIDLPGSSDTLPEKINSDGVISGAYDVTQPITRGFIFSSGKYQTVITPFGSQSEAASVSDAGMIAGNSWTDVPGPESGFIKNRNVFTRYDFPDENITSLTSINTFGDLGGFFIGSDTFPRGVVWLYGYPHLVQDALYITDINDDRQVVGYAYNREAGRFQPFICTPALADR